MGDAITSLDNQPITLYDQIMARLPQLPRPLAIGFRKKMEGLGSNDLQPPQATPKTVRIMLTMDDDDDDDDNDDGSEILLGC